MLKKHMLHVSVVVTVIAWALVHALSLAIDVPTFHIDGAFQTASGLYRLDAGQFPGKDFFPYLGIGPLLLLFPFFKALGSDLMASVATAHLVTLLGGWFGSAVIWHLVWRPRGFLASLVAAGVLYVVPVLGSLHAGIDLSSWFEFATSPSYSLRPIRVLAPYLTALAFLALVRACWSDVRTVQAAGLIGGLALCWSNDYAIPTAGLFTVLVLARTWARARHPEARTVPWRLALVMILSLLATWLITLLVVTRGHPLAMLQYNFTDVAPDQWWYFGPYGEFSRIFGPMDLHRLHSRDLNRPIVMLLVTGVIAWRSRRIEHVLLLWLGLVLAAGGVLASVGGHLADYFGGFKFWGTMTEIVGATRLVWLVIERRVPHPALRVQAGGVLSVVLALVLAAGLVVETRQLMVAREAAAQDPARFHVPELGGHLGTDWRDYIEHARRTPADARVVEEYWGIWSATRRIFPRWPVDSVIHALGRVRTQAAEQMAQADVVISTRHRTSRDWQPWNLGQNHWFHGPLFEAWQPTLLSPATVVWQRLPQPREMPSLPCQVVDGGRALALTVDREVFAEVTLDHRLVGPGRHLLMAQNNLSFASDAGGHVSLDPKGTHAVFPAWLPRSGVHRLDLDVLGSAPQRFEALACRAREITFSHPDLLRRPEWLGNGFFPFERAWQHGIWQQGAGFYVPDSEPFRSNYQPGRMVRFEDGSQRRIAAVAADGLRWQVQVDGPPLDLKAVGLPNSFEVIDPVLPQLKVLKD